VIKRHLVSKSLDLWKSWSHLSNLSIDRVVHLKVACIVKDERAGRLSLLILLLLVISIASIVLKNSVVRIYILIIIKTVTIVEEIN